MPAETLLRLRRDLLRAGRRVLGAGPMFEALFDPPVAEDPLARRRFQKPGPPFVVLPSSDLPRPVEPGDSLAVAVHFFGRGIQLIESFLFCLTQLGRNGLWQGEACFEVGALAAEDPAGNLCEIPLPGSGVVPPWPIDTGRWWLDSRSAGSCWRLRLLSPARLMSRGRPLFRAGLRELFPFVMRRVGSVAYYHCGIEVLPQVEEALADLAAIDEVRNSLHWRDWRTLDGSHGPVDLGGLVGALVFHAPRSATALGLLHLGSLLNIGRGATYAAGHYCLELLSDGTI